MMYHHSDEPCSEWQEFPDRQSYAGDLFSLVRQHLLPLSFLGTLLGLSTSHSIILPVPFDITHYNDKKSQSPEDSSTRKLETCFSSPYLQFCSLGKHGMTLILVSFSGKEIPPHNPALLCFSFLIHALCPVSPEK